MFGEEGGSSVMGRMIVGMIVASAARRFGEVGGSSVMGRTIVGMTVASAARRSATRRANDEFVRKTIISGGVINSSPWK